MGFLLLFPCAIILRYFWKFILRVSPLVHFLVYAIFSNIAIATGKNPPYFAVIFNQCHLHCGYKCYVTSSSYCQFSISEYVKLLSPTHFLSTNAQRHSNLISAWYSAYSVSIPSIWKCLYLCIGIKILKDRNFINHVSFESLCPSLSTIVCTL